MKWFKFPVWILIRSLISIIFTFLDVDLFLKMPKVCLSLSSLADSICLKKKEVVRPPIRLVALDKFGLSSKMEHPPYGTFNVASGNHLYMTLQEGTLYRAD